jgi:hypothetical protein
VAWAEAPTITPKARSTRNCSGSSHDNVGTCIRHAHVHPIPLLDDARHPCLDRLVVMDIDLNFIAVPPDASMSATALSAVISWPRPRIPPIRWYS